MSNIAKNIEAVRKRIMLAASKCGRSPDDVHLLAISKIKPATAVKEAFNAGQKLFGENYVQELKEKHEKLSDLDIEWHFTGHLQRNKVKYVVPFVKAIHSLDSIKLATEINRRAERQIDCFIEVNVAEEASKTGTSAEKIYELVTAISKMTKLNLVGLMTMPPYDQNPEESRPYFSRLRHALDDINKKGIYPKKLTELSMGMTGDMEVAIEEGSTYVRVGTAIFGGRA